MLIILNSIATWFQEMNVNAIYSGCNTTLSLFKEALSDIFNTHVHTILENTANHYNENEYSVICTENSHQYQLFSTFFPHKKNRRNSLSKSSQPHRNQSDRKSHSSDVPFYKTNDVSNRYFRLHTLPAHSSQRSILLSK